MGEFVTVPLSAHGTINQSPTIQAWSFPLTSIENCGQRLTQSFFLSKGESLNKTCLDRLQPIDWSGKLYVTRQISNTFFGTDYLWGDGPSPSPSPRQGPKKSGKVPILI